MSQNEQEEVKVYSYGHVAKMYEEKLGRKFYGTYMSRLVKEKRIRRYIPAGNASRSFYDAQDVDAWISSLDVPRVKLIVVA